MYANVIHERTKFHKSQQKESEAVEEFYRSLRSLITHCQYTDAEEQERDRFVVGLRDRKLEERRQLTPDFPLKKALEMARQDE